ncbi:MAG TPA: SPFH domain-containing protein [Opitutales bacterium]|jgi:hypothetical protein|nr:SPFH domain-containing protein [Opitutales bacterium]
MSFLDEVVSRTRYVEKLLEDFGATESGLNMALDQVGDRLKGVPTESLRYLAKVRNQLVHEHDYKFYGDETVFLHTCDDAIIKLQAIVTPGNRGDASLAAPEQESLQSQHSPSSISTKEMKMNANPDIEMEAIKSEFITTYLPSFKSVYTKYPSSPEARLVFHTKYRTRIFATGSYKFKFFKEWDKISFVNLIKSVPLPLSGMSFSNPIFSADGIPVKVVGSVEIRIKDEKKAIESVVLNFKNELKIFQDSVESIIRSFCEDNTAKQISANNKAFRIEFEKAMTDIKHLAFSHKSDNLSLDVPLIRQTIESRTKTQIDTIGKLEGIANEQEVGTAKIIATMAVNKVASQLRSLEIEQQIQIDIIRIRHELETATKRAENAARIENVQLEVVKEKMKVIAKNKDAIALIAPDWLRENYRHEEVLSSNAAEVRLQEFLVKSFETMLNTHSKNQASSPIIVTQK